MIVAGFVAGLGRPAAPARPTRAPSAGFAVADPSAPPAPQAPAAPVALDAMLALQEQEGDAARDRRARQHGQALLQALAALQHALLAGDGEGDALRRLAALAGAAAHAADPALAAAVRALALRAQVELARRGM